MLPLYLLASCCADLAMFKASPPYLPTYHCLWCALSIRCRGRWAYAAMGSTGGTEQPRQQPEARQSVSANSPQWLGEPWNLSLHHRAAAESPRHASSGCIRERALAFPVAHCQGSPSSEPCAGNTRIWPRVFLLGFHNCAVPTPWPGALINIFKGAQNSTDLLLSKQVRSPSIKGRRIWICAGALGCLGKWSVHSSTSLCLG